MEQLVDLVIIVVITIIENINKTLITEIIKKKYQKVTLNIIKKERTKKIYFFINLWKMCVSDTPCLCQKYCRKYQKLAFNSKSYSSSICSNILTQSHK